MTEPSDPDATLPLSEEQIEIAKHEIERGRVSVRIRVDEREELAQAWLHQEDVSIERVPVGRVVDAPPPVREEDGVLIVPLLEERMVVLTELILKEELRIVRRSHVEETSQLVRLRTERAEPARTEPTSDSPDRREPPS